MFLYSEFEKADKIIRYNEAHILERSLNLLFSDLRKLHNEELHNFYSSPNIIRMIMSRRMRWAGHVTRMREKRNAYRTLVGKSEGKRLLGRQTGRWVNNIKIDLR
jgi:hypothetical protein